jgi:hypothetical protein
MEYKDVAASLSWRTSSFCNNGTCVEVALESDFVAVRDSKEKGKTPFFYSTEEWRQFVAGVKNGEFDL